jgi:cytochrome c oxidase assembly protein Cox11
MPVFFFIDPEFDEDPATFKFNEITLSYTFFDAKHPGTKNVLAQAPLPPPDHKAPHPPAPAEPSKASA